MSKLSLKKIGYLILAFVTIFVLGLCIKIALTNFNSSEKQLISGCEKQLKKADSLYQICRIDNNKIVPIAENNLDTDIRASNKIIISLNLPKLLQSSWQNAETKTAINQSNYADPISLCFAVYPALVPSHFTALFGGTMTEEQKVSLNLEYIKNFAWVPTASMGTQSLQNNSNIACTQPFNRKDAKLISFVFSLPGSAFFQKGIVDEDLNKYGVKVILNDQQFVANQKNKMDIVENILENKNKMVPLFILKHWVQF